MACCLSRVAFAEKGEQPGKKAHGALMASTADLKWNDVPGFPGVKLTVVEGDASKGPHHSFIKFAPGFSAPLHHHTADHYGTVIAGTLVLTVGGKANKLPAGSYFGFTDKTKHATACEAGAECVIFLDVRGKWDVVPEETTLAPKK
jgi:quercetin dioxygenase-like cupin family protein